ncbi:AI-2E family transporter [Kushneria phosphatilytica]|uniref:AI-2E family transporter n=1 Tax=Kushneria phosphatilytica TaxID=657387 RepID=A0A1S1P2Y2_9GAMM|nr:AI-2E family transporter [Kushneria phosphatilytica]OHV13439.1 AI-2E family transporter [Kushneria phosphatilytica]QEL10522.1 AI-2E family transporter [Kushneria phosphatilytica]
MTFKALMKRLVSRYFSDEEAIVLGGLLITGLLVVLLFGGMLAPFFTALIIAFVLQGGVSWLERRGLPRLVAVGLIFVLFLGVLLTLALIVLPLVWNQLAHLTQEIPDLLGRSRILLEELRDRYPTIITPDQIQRWISAAGNEFSLLGRRLLSLSLNSLGSLLGVVIYLVLVPILVFFMLKDRERLIGFLLSMLPKKRALMTRIWREMDDQIANFIRGKFIEIVIVAVVSWITFWALGLPYATLLALIVGLSVLVPYIGAAVATLPIAAVAGLTFGFSEHFVWVMVAYAILQALDGNVLVPVLFSEAVNLHPVAIILAVLFFGGIWGFWGIFFAIPLATLLKALMFAWPRNRDRIQQEDAA